MACFTKYSFSSCIEVLSMNKKILPSIKDLVFCFRKRLQYLTEQCQMNIYKLTKGTDLGHPFELCNQSTVFSSTFTI